MVNVATIKFVDCDSDEEALAIVRASRGIVALGISLIHDGDIEVVMKSEDCDRLLDALQQALAVAKA
jgi:hypothetical protein